MRIELVFEDWRKLGEAESVMDTPLGAELSEGDFHSGTVFHACIAFFGPGVEDELVRIFEKTGAYPVFRMIPSDGHCSGCATV